MQHFGIGFAHGVGEQAIAYVAAVDEKILAIAALAGRLRCAGAAEHAQRAPVRLDLQAVGEEGVAEQRGGALRTGLRAHHVAHAAVVLEHEGDARARQRDAPEHFVAMAELGLLGAQELAPRRRIEIEVGHRDGGALRACGRPHLADLRAFGTDFSGMGGVARAAGDRQARHRGDGSQGLATEPHGDHRFQILEARDLARGVACERERQLLARDAGTIVLDLDALGAAGIELHRDRLRAGIDRVLEQFLEHRRRALDHLAGGDLADQELRQNADGAHASSDSAPWVMRTSSSYVRRNTVCGWPAAAHSSL